MSLVRMTLEEKPKYLSSEQVESITARGGAGTFCTVRYLDGREHVVDGTPDGVFKALFNPPDMVLKSDVAKVLSALEEALSDARTGRGGGFYLDRFIEQARESLGVPRARR